MIHSNRKHNWIFGWNPPWHRKGTDMNQLSSISEQQRQHESTSYRQSQPKTSAVGDDSIYYNNNNSNGNYNDSESILLPQQDQTMDTGYPSPLSSSSSSFTSSFKRNTKASVLDFFHRRKSSTPSIMSSQTSSQQSFPTGPLSSVPAGRKSTLPTISPSLTSAATTVASTQSQPANNSVMHSTSPASTFSSTPSCSGNSLHQNNTITSTGTTSSSVSSNQHHRFPFIHHHHHHHQQNETNNNNISTSISEEQLSPLYQHRHASLSPHNALASHHPSSTSTPRSSSSMSASVRPYDSLINNSESFYEHTMDMEDSAPPTIDDTKRIILRHDLTKLALDGLFKSPLDPQQESERQVLQIGCGEGSWCIDCAKEFPHWFVLGLDDRNGGPLISAASGKKIMLSGTSSSSSSASAPPPPANATLIPSSSTTTTTCAPSSSISSSVPPGGHGTNFRFIRSTTSLVKSLKMIPDGQFDLVYGRFLALSLPPSEYEDLVSECWRVCKSGGFVEFTELDMRIYGTSGSGILVKRLNQQVVSAMKKRKLDPRLPRHLQDLFFKLLVEDEPSSSRRRQTSYQVKYNSLPLGVWGGRIGVMFRDDIHDVLDALDVSTSHVDDDGSDKDGEQRLPEDGWKATTDVLDDELDSHMAFMNLYQIFAQKHKV